MSARHSDTADSLADRLREITALIAEIDRQHCGQVREAYWFGVVFGSWVGAMLVAIITGALA